MIEQFQELNISRNYGLLKELTLRGVYASLAHPNLFKSVEIDQNLYWDGYYTSNPPFFYMFREGCDEIFLIRLIQRNREDIGEDLEVIDNYIMHLKLAGKLRKVKGIILGRMIDCYDSSDHKYSIRDFLRDSLRGINVPVIYGFPSGHRTKGDINITLPLGVSVTIDAEKPSLFIDEAAVR